jgi:dTDP-4-dehydrorhamnose reductase
MRLLITGASGQLGGYLLRHMSDAGRTALAWSRMPRPNLFGVELEPVDLTRPDQVAAAFRRAHPDAVIHAAALSNVAECYRQPKRARHVNVEATAQLADLAAGAGCRLVYVSTDLVFDGAHGGYREQDPPAPLSIYGRTKLDAESAVLATPSGVVARVSLLFGPSLVGRASFFDQQLAALRQRQPIRLFEDEWRTPLSLLTAARALIELADADYTGKVHIGGPERMSRLEMGQRLAESLAADDSALIRTRRGENPAPETRPSDTSLDSSLWRRLFPRIPWPTWSDAIRDLMAVA